jgi:2,7-dihydroxy-5-methyl-1-naphthoate 7-O-methyltransferase
VAAWWELADLATPWCVHVVVTLRVPRHMEAGKSSIEEIAAAAGANAAYLERVMRHLVQHGLFEEPSRGRFTLNEPARGLLDPAASLGLDLDSFGGRMAGAWNTLLSAVRTGAPAYHEAFGRPYWEDLAANPRVARDFDRLMGVEGHGTPDADVLIDGDWSAIRTVVDVGGGTGALLAEVLRAHPHVRGILVDLPETIARSASVFESAGVADRATASGQSFFEPLPRGADLYLLKSVLSDWPDADAEAILRRCADAAAPAGRVVLLNGVSPDDPPPPDLLMLVLVGGKMRSLPEFTDLASRAGLRVRATARQPSGRFLVECGA